MSKEILVTVIGGIILMVIAYFIKRKEKPFSKEEKEVLLQFVQELNELVIYFTGNTNGKFSHVGNFIFKNVGKENTLEILRGVLDKPIKFNTPFPTKKMLEVANNPLFPADIKREFPFLLSSAFTEVNDDTDTLEISVRGKDSILEVNKPTFFLVFFDHFYFHTLSDLYKSLVRLKDYIETKAKINF